MAWQCTGTGTRNRTGGYPRAALGDYPARVAARDRTAKAGIDRRHYAESARARTGAHSTSTGKIQGQSAPGCRCAEYQHRHTVAQDEGVRARRLSMMA